MNYYIVNGHPNAISLSQLIANGLKEKTDGNLTNLYELNFNYNYISDLTDESDIQLCKKYITNSDKIVFVFPMWWGSYPAILKAWLDRVLSPGFAYKYNQGGTTRIHR
jgi:NAD(P)H dehydrogenase (quinone)